MFYVFHLWHRVLSHVHHAGISTASVKSRVKILTCEDKTGRPVGAADFPRVARTDFRSVAVLQEVTSVERSELQSRAEERPKKKRKPKPTGELDGLRIAQSPKTLRSPRPKPCQGHLPGKRFVQPFLWNVVLKASVRNDETTGRLGRNA